ncbi:hypothetical protein B0O99DRAFT_518682, partial [Bisporella sp. PMI_857]
LIVRTSLVHDAQIAAAGVDLPDFQLAKLMFPFIDRLRDGFSSFVWMKKISTNENGIIQAGIRDYDQTPINATFQPILEAYERSPATTTSPRVGISFVASVDNKPWLNVQLKDSNKHYLPWLYLLEFFKNVTNQPIIGNATTCYQQVNLFNTTLSADVHAPAYVCGSVGIEAPLPPTSHVYRDVFGIHVDLAFLENNFLNCTQLKRSPEYAQLMRSRSLS